MEINTINNFSKKLKEEYDVDLIIGERIDYGSQATIYSGEINSKKLVIKIMHNDKTGKNKDIKCFNNEVKLLSKLELYKENIIPKLCYHCFSDRGYIIMENLVDYKPLIDVENWTYHKIKKTFVNLIRALVKFNKYAVHKDIKGDNVMIDENCNIKFIDFGLSNVIGSGTDNNMFSLQDTSHYYAFRSPILVAKQFTNLEIDFSDEEIAKHDDLHACICMMFSAINGYNHVKTSGILHAPSYVFNLPKDIVKKDFSDTVLKCMLKSSVKGKNANEINELLNTIVLTYNDNMWTSYDIIVKKLLNIESLNSYT